MAAEHEHWTDQQISEAFGAVNTKLDKVLKVQRSTRREQRLAAERARRDWLTFFAPVAVALVGLLGTIVTILLTRGSP